MQYFPLLDIRQAIADADRNLADVVYFVTTLQDESEGHYPPQAAQLLANVVAIREQLTRIIPKELWSAIVEEQSAWDAEEMRWEPSNY